jgi:hypothetical protein
MKKIPFILFTVLLLTCFTQCKKQHPEKKYTITGKLLESAGNPVPVPDLPMFLYRKERSGFTGWSPGIAINFKTNQDGSFSVTYPDEKGTGLYALGSSDEPLSITGSDPVLYPGVFAEFYPLPANKDTSLSIVYFR